MRAIGVTFLVFLAIACGSKADESEVTRIFKESRIIPDLIEDDVPGLLKMTFDDNVAINLGTEVTPYQTRNQPELDWDADENEFYTIMTLDPDAPSPDNPFVAPLNTWMIGNIPGKDVRSGEILFAYLPSATPKGAGFNRYVTLVYKQPSGKIKFTEDRIDKYRFDGRDKFQLKEFTSKYGLGKPIAANFHQTQFDHYSIYVHGQVQFGYEINKF